MTEQAGPRQIRIAVVHATDGHVNCCGPDDYDDGHYRGQMDAALTWLLESGHLPANRYWVTVDLPAPSATEIDLDAEVDSTP